MFLRATSPAPGLCRRRPSVLASALVVAVLAAGCTIVIVSGPSAVTPGDTVTYVLEVGSRTGSDTDVTLLVAADVPAGWNLLSSAYDGTIDGVPSSGSGTVVASTLCDDLAGNVLPGFQRIYVAAGPFAHTSGIDIADVTLDFDALSQPAGMFQIFFRFAADGSDPQCSTAAVRTVNRESPPLLSFVQALFDDTQDADGLDAANSVAVSPDGAHVVATAEQDNSVAVFARDPGGELEYAQIVVNGSGGVSGIADANGVAISPDGKHAYVTGRLEGSIAAFKRDPDTGWLTFFQALFDGNGGVDGLRDVNSVTLSPAGDSVYTTSFENAVAVFARDAASGELRFVEAELDGAGGVDGLAGAQAVSISPDGLNAYAAGANDDALAVFARDPATGELNFIQVLFDGIDGVDGLEGARSVALSGDGRHVYTAADGFPDSIGVFARAPATGTLSFVQALAHGAGGVVGLEHGEALAVSRTGAQVFATGENSVVAFERNAVSGELTFVEAQFEGDGEPPNEGLDGVNALAVAPDGADLYVTSFRSNSLVAFDFGAVFADGFESGDTSRWSNVAP